jgi:hypothetical protein
VDLHPLRPRGSTQELERLAEPQPEPLGEDSLRLLDLDPRPEGALDVGLLLERRLGHREQAPKSRLCLLPTGAASGSIARSKLRLPPQVFSGSRRPSPAALGRV